MGTHLLYKGICCGYSFALLRHMLWVCFYKENQKKRKKKQEAHGPRFAHLSDIATADMQVLCNIFPILSLQLMKISSFEQFLVLKTNLWGLTVNGA